MLTLKGEFVMKLNEEVIKFTDILFQFEPF